MMGSFLNLGKHLHELRDFCQATFEREAQLRRIQDVSLKIRVYPLFSNGTLRVSSKTGNKGVIVVNLMPFGKKRDQTDAMRYFSLHATIVHELCHLELLRNQSPKRYCELAAFWEQRYRFSKLHLLDGVDALLMREKYTKLHKRRCMVSSAEILCNLTAYQSAYYFFSAALDQQERTQIETAIESLRFLNDHVSIGYAGVKRPYNQFARMMKESQRLIRIKKYKWESAWPLIYLYHFDGKVKTLDQLFGERTENNKDLIDKLLINMFICADINLEKMFSENERIKKHIAMLANQYCNDTVYYLQNLKIGEVFVDQAVLRDNAAMLIKNTTRLNFLMNRYGMERTGGSVLPLYNIGT